MKTQIDFDDPLLATDKLDKLADGRWHNNSEPGKADPASRKTGYPIKGFAPLNVKGMYVRLNGVTLEHGLICVRSAATDKRTGIKGDGSKLPIGKLSEFKISKGKYDIDAIIDKCAELYEKENGAKDAPAKSDAVITVQGCLDEYLSDRVAMLDVDGKIVKLNGTAITKSMVTLGQVVSTVKRYSHNWMTTCVTKIDADMIIDQAALIRDGKFKNAEGEKIGTYSTARTWLGTMSTIHKAGALKHQMPNLFEALRRKSYKKVESAQRRFTDKEIALILNWTLQDTPAAYASTRPDESKYIRVLAAKFALLTALRAGDMVTLKHEDIEEHNGKHYLKAFISKGNRWQWFPICDRAMAVITDANELVVNSEYIFPASTGEAYYCGTKAFEVVRDMLLKEGLIKEEPVEKLGKTKPKTRLMLSHDVRRTLETLGGAVTDKKGIRVIDQDTIDHMMQHKGNALSAQYNCKTEVDHIALADHVAPSYEAYANHLFEIAKAAS